MVSLEKRHLEYLVPFVLIGMIYVADLLTPFDVAVWLGYLVVPFLVPRKVGRGGLIVCAAVSTFLILLSYQHIRTELGADLAVGDCSAIVLVLWLTTAFHTRHRQTMQSLQRLHAELEQRVAERTQELARTVDVLHGAIQEKEQVERALRESEQLFRLAVDNYPGMFLIYGADLSMRFVNARALALDGLSWSELQMTAGEDGLPVPVTDALAPILRRTVESCLMRQEEIHVPLTGSEFVLNTTFVPLLDENGSPQQVIAIAEDVTDRVRAEEALMRSVEEMQDLYNLAPCGYHSLDAEGAIVRINDTELHWLGYARPEVVGRRFAEFLTPASQRRFRKSFVRFLQEGEVRDVEYELVRKDGTIFPILLNATTVNDGNGRYLMSRSTLFDITERKENEEKLLRMNRLFAVLSSIDQVIIHAVDRETIFHQVCRIAVEAGGFQMAWIGLLDEETGAVQPVAACGEGVEYLEKISIRVQADNPFIEPSVRAILRGGVAICNSFQDDQCSGPWCREAERRGIRSQAAIALKLYGKPLGVLSFCAGEENYFRLQYVDLLQQVAADISFALENMDREYRRREAEQALQRETVARLKTLEELREKDRLMMHQSRHAAMGEMIGNIAHQWRQPLNKLGLIIQRLPLFYDTGDLSRDFVRDSSEEAMKLVYHMSETINDFRNFFKPDKEKVEFSVEQAIDRALALVGGAFNDHQISVVTSIEGTPRILGYPNEFAQALLIILNNARDAYLEGQQPVRTIAIESSRMDNMVVVTITDRAGGIAEEIIEKIFDPYFSTKGPEQGTGIGLFMAKTIIEKNMGGRLLALNTEDGAQFRIEV